MKIFQPLVDKLPFCCGEIAFFRKLNSRVERLIISQTFFSGVERLNFSKKFHGCKEIKILDFQNSIFHSGKIEFSGKHFPGVQTLNISEKHFPGVEKLKFSGK